MRALYISMATAAAAGLLTGAAFRPHNELSAQPGGPRIVASDRTLVPDYEPVLGLIQYRPGPTPEYVVGTDWVNPKPAPIVRASLSDEMEAKIRAERALAEAALASDGPILTASYASGRVDHVTPAGL